VSAATTGSAALPRTPDWRAVEVGQRISSDERLLDWQDVVLQVSGSQDWNRVHYDHQFAVDSGHREVFFNVGWTSATLSKLLTDWCGADGWLCELEFQMRRMISPGDTLTVRAEITGKRVEDGRGLVEFDVWLETDREGTTTPGRAVVALPIPRTE